MPSEAQQEGPPAAAPTSTTNEREAAQLLREPVTAADAEPWLLVANVMASEHGSFTASGLRKLAVLATVRETIHVAAGYLEAEGYTRVAERLRACLQLEEDPTDG